MRTIQLGLILELPDNLEDGSPTYWGGLIQDLIDNRWKQSTFTKMTVTVPDEMPPRVLWDSLTETVKTQLIDDTASDVYDNSRKYAIGHLEGLDDEALQELIDFLPGGRSTLNSG